MTPSNHQAGERRIHPMRLNGAWHAVRGRALGQSVLIRLFVGAYASLVLAPMAKAQIVLNYDVRRTATAPTIDGIASPGEWDNATAAAGSWGVLGESPPPNLDTENNRFRMTWDDAALYVLYESNYGGYFPPINLTSNPNMTFGEDNLNLYFDPNTDDEPNFTSNPESNVDGYQFAFNQYTRPGGGALISTNAARQGVGIYTEAHVNATSGNQAHWGGVGVISNRGPAMGDIIVAQTNTSSVGLAEVVFPWTAFNAAAEINGPGATIIQTGLNHPMAPTIGDQWFFNMLRINSNSNGGNFRPIWNWHSGLFGALHPHGTLTFVEGAARPGDFNNDGSVNGEDLAVWQEAFGGNFDGDEFLVWQRNFDGNPPSGLTAVPEPSTTLLGLATLLLAGVRRPR